MKRALPLLLLLGLLAAESPARAQQAPADAPPSQETVHKVLDDEVLQLFATLPVQEGGRVKPLATLASFKLLKLRGVRAAYTAGEEHRRLTPIEWLAHCLIYPELARTYPVFVVADSEVLDRIGLAHEGKKKRDRYSYEELQPGRERLFQEFQKLKDKERQDLDRIQQQLVDLHTNVLEFELLTHHLDYARFGIATTIHPMVNMLFAEQPGQQGPPQVPFHRLLEKGPEIVRAVKRLKAGDVPAQLADMRESALHAFEQVLDVVQRLGFTSKGLSLIPPADKGEETWRTPDDVGRAAFSMDPKVAPQEIGLLADWEALVQNREDPAGFKAALQKLHADTVAMAEARGQYAKVPAEVAFYRWDFFYRALLCFVGGFICIAITWMLRPGSLADKAFFAGCSALTGIGLGLCTAGIIFRCYLRSRPPVSTLYETILFITTCAVLVSLILEWINRQRVGMALAPTIGALGMFLAYKYELHDAVDTMPNLVAVLDTNFWLSTHVTTVTLGYSAGLLAGFLGHLYLVMRMLKLKERAWYRGLARMIYGVLCFGLLFSIVGTILGGVWANDSWGRFWGWDPKENGALMIVLWELAILHGRLGAYLRDWGMAFAAAATTLVVAFSWWGVNLLGVGLHSYGFTSGVKMVLEGYYAVDVVFLGLAVVWWALNRDQLAGSKPKAEAPAEAQAEPAPTETAQAEFELAPEPEPAAEPVADAPAEPAADAPAEPAGDDAPTEPKAGGADDATT